MKKLVLIHGALGSGKEFENVIPLIEDDFKIFNYELPHHGAKKDSELTFTIENLADDLSAFLEDKGKCILYGFSLGGYVALYAASRANHNIEGVITQGTKMDWSPETAAKEIRSLDEGFLKNKVPPFYDYLKTLHGSYLNELLKKTAALMLNLGADPALNSSMLRSIRIPVRMTRGGRDKMVSREETINASQFVPQCHYFEIPSLPHPLGFIAPKDIARHIKVQAQSMHYKWAKTSTGRMAYETIGNSSGETCILFLHEAIGSIAQWQDFPRKLTNALDLPGIVPEFPGYGFSDQDDRIRNASYLHQFSLETLPEFIAEVCPNKKLILVGHSDGGSNALLFSSRFSKQVIGIVTMAAHFINEEVTRAGIQPAIDAFKEGKLKGLEFFHGEKTEHLFLNWARTWLQDDFLNWDLSKDIKGNQIPALIMQGDKDQYGSDKQVYGICQLLENAKPLFINECGHAPHIEQQKVVIDQIKLWKEKLN